MQNIAFISWVRYNEIIICRKIVYMVCYIKSKGKQMKTQQQTAHGIGKIGYWTATVFLLLCISLIVFNKNGLMNMNFGRLFWNCGLHDNAHLYCPGCGGTRAVKELLQGHIIASFMYHPCILIYTLYFLWYYIGTTLGILWKGKRRFFRFRLWIVMVLIFLPVVFGIGRDILLVYAHYDYIGELLPYWQ